MDEFKFDIVVLGATPGGIAAAIAAARMGRSPIVLERSAHVGGLPANGLGATDIITRDAVGGLFSEFVERVRDYYVRTYGPASEQVADCRDGYHFEPSVAEAVFEGMLVDHPAVTVRRCREFDHEEELSSLGDGGESHASVATDDGRVAAITVEDRNGGQRERYHGDVFVDATYEGDLAAAADVSYRIGREGVDAHGEPLAGKVYAAWAGTADAVSTGRGDNAIQAYNYRLCLTTGEEKASIEKPPNYDRSEYLPLAEDIRTGNHTHAGGEEFTPEGIEWAVSLAPLPNGKVDANNSHLTKLSTDLPEENWPWPSAGWAWRDRFAGRLRNYTLGLLYFLQHDPEVPEATREQVGEWGLAADEYEDNDHFPRQVYVREGRRVEGEYTFTAYDALPVGVDDEALPGNVSVTVAHDPHRPTHSRPPIHPSSVTANHYALDSHGVRKREPARPHLDGFVFLAEPTEPYTVPFGVLVPKRIDGLLTPVPVSGTHIGFSTLRMEPCWMALGEAAGVAASLSLDQECQVRNLPISLLQRELLAGGTVLIHYEDVDRTHPAFEALQFFGVRGFVPAWKARLDDAVTASTAERWLDWAAPAASLGYEVDRTTRGELLNRLYDGVEAETVAADVTSPYAEPVQRNHL
ncbi:FAD-dependent oxidoreductase [Halegenticoccus soli]|uniref:FAD-dependent oxidoreductase n=1 Tax=Halegenticoccus soli TaxID=1985678 RepID=UPI000C6EDAF3|nr:FAD-dependent oxidoreductase [Halegenticoccus soli]